MGVGGQRHASASLSPGKTLYQLYRGLSGPLGWSGRVRKLSPATEIRSPDHPTRSESLYRLSYPGLMYLFGTNNNCLPSLESNTLRIHMYNLMCICRWSQRAHLWSCKNGVPEKCSRWFWLLQPCRYQCVAWGLLEYSAVSLGKWFVLFYCFYRLYLQRSRGSRTATLMGLLNCEDKDNTVLQNNRNHSTGYRAIILEPGILNFSRFRTKYLPHKRCSELRYTLCSELRYTLCSEIRYTLCSEIRYTLCSEIRYALCSEIRYALCSEIRYALCSEIRYALCSEIRYALCSEIRYALCSEIRCMLCSKSRLRRKFCLWRQTSNFQNINQEI